MEVVRGAINRPAGSTLESGRLLFVYDGEYAHNNGVSSYMRTISNYATDHGHNVARIVGKDSTGEDDTYCFSRTLPITANGSRSFIPLHTKTAAMASFVEDFDPSAAHIQLPYLPTMAGKVIDQLGSQVSLVGTFHTPTPTGWLRLANKVNARISKSQLARFDQFFSVSEVAQTAAKMIYGVDSEILPCPVEIPETVSVNRNVSGNETRIAFMGRIVGRKGLATLIDSLAFVDPEVAQNIHVRVIGDGPDRPEIEEQAAQIGAEGQIKFLGQLCYEQAQTELSSSDLAIYPSRGGESFGIVLAEAMATRGPIVLASNISGYDETLRDSPGSLVPKNDPEALGKLITEVASDPSLRSRLYQEQQRILESYDITEVVGPRLLSAYGLGREA